jgi:GTPase
MFERPRSGERAVLVRLALGGPADPEDLREFTQLAESAGATVVATIAGSRDRPDPRYFVGSGKADEIRATAEEFQADVDPRRPPAEPEPGTQPGEAHRSPRARPQRPDPRHLRAARRSHEGKLEVELAQLKHIASRLVRGWTHLERQRGGGIGLRGPGETQLETDRRLLGQRVKVLTRSGSRSSSSSARRVAARASRSPCRRSRSSATPTPASRRCSAR